MVLSLCGPYCWSLHRHSAWWQAGKQSLLIKPSASHVPCVLLQCTAINVRFLFTIFNKCTRKFQFNILHVVSSFQSQHLKDVLVMVSFGLQVCIKCNKQIVHCTLKFLLVKINTVHPECFFFLFRSSSMYGLFPYTLNMPHK